MIAPVIALADYRPAPVRTELQVMLAEARADARAEGRAEGFYDGMRAAMESMRAPVPAMLPVRSLSVVEMGGCAS